MEHPWSDKATITLLIVTSILLSSHAATRSVPRDEQSMAATTIQIPQSVRIEHAAIHSALVDATKAAGRVGETARALAEVLHPHFVREEEIALPPLGLPARIAAGRRLTDAEAAEALTTTDSLRRELPQMLEEHKRIRKAIDNLRSAARTEHAVRYEQLAEQLALHAQSEEEVLYPAAVLVGDVIRSQLKRD
jgi:iron-sulfur cluster repair protein YtfE (RIC family)